MYYTSALYCVLYLYLTLSLLPILLSASRSHAVFALYTKTNNNFLFIPTSGIHYFVVLYSLWLVQLCLIIYIPYFWSITLHLTFFSVFSLLCHFCSIYGNYVLLAVSYWLCFFVCHNILFLVKLYSFNVL